MRYVIVGFIMLITACAPKTARDQLSLERHRLKQSGLSQAFSEGYSDGCSTGRAEAGLLPYTSRQNRTRMQSDKEYRTAWLQGRRQCLADAPIHPPKP